MRHNCELRIEAGKGKSGTSNGLQEAIVVATALNILQAAAASFQAAAAGKRDRPSSCRSH